MVMEADTQKAFRHARSALELLPEGLESERAYARGLLAGLYQMQGDLAKALETMESALEGHPSDASRGRLMLSICWIYSMEADRAAVERVASAILAYPWTGPLPETVPTRVACSDKRNTRPIVWRTRWRPSCLSLRIPAPST